MKEDNKPYIFVIGNEKGGAGKTTCSMHLIIGLLEQGYKVASMDTDSRQHSLTNYLDNRKAYNQKNIEQQVQMPLHFHELSMMCHRHSKSPPFKSKAPDTLKDVPVQVPRLLAPPQIRHVHLLQYPGVVHLVPVMPIR